MEVPIEKTATSQCAQMQHPTSTPSSSTQTYQYLPLKHDRDIRLLCLLPGFNEAPLSCFLMIVSLSNLPVYEAISYTWGEPIFSAWIKCAPRGRLPITENLSTALLHLRLADQIRVLWVDAICINQQDLVERSHQVTLMRDTFEGAENVIVWLGEDTGNADKAFEILRAIESSSSDAHIFNLNLLDSESGKALRELLGRSWFRRIWVVQELVCASKATITCGSHEMEWERFLNVAGRINETGYLQGIADESVSDALFALAGMLRGRQMRQQRENDDLETLLYSYRGCLASDPRDKVFALVGMASGQIAAAYTPNYSIEALEVYKNLAIQLIIAERNPNALVHCTHIAGSQAPLLPSWVPDWSQRLVFICSPLVWPSAYNAAAGTSFKGRVSEDLDELFLDGVILNTVEVLGSIRYPGAVQSDSVKNIQRMIELNEEYLGMFRQSPHYRGCYWSAFTRALVADKDHTGSRIGQRDLREVYFAYRKYFSYSLIFLATKRLSFHRGVDGTVEFPEYRDLDRAISYAGFGRTFCIFDDGRAGWVPNTAEVGDRIAIFLGATVPILLRPRGNGYIVLGEAYVHEMMDGQAFERPDVQIETITLI
ncbi:hypothetical protein JMJ35_005866 [Cladonia borealis]|uniref:Heterokaryon incompatibility domain-containing protein n=1 Tax=Cladonia borealis TaxID=184061 RepID=A0AA39QY25_9LECA|nr:hypothetical protein JMJ35_005866 [Cladonia borealis]